MTNGISACFDTIWALASVAAGVTGVARWNEADGWYGALNNDVAWTPRPAAYAWHLLNTRVARLGGGAGAVLVAAASASANVSVFAAIAAAAPPPSTHSYVVVVINTSGQNATVALDVAAWGGGASGAPPPSATAVETALITDAGLALGAASIGAITAAEGVALPANAVAFWSFAL
jgi:hypothetical protein